jgi:membrane-bound lytic murein transglycosylase D
MRVFYVLVLCFSIISCTEENSTLKEEQDPVVESNDNHGIPLLPAEMTLFGELVGIDNFDIKERLDKEVIVNTYYHSSTVQILKRANRHFPLIEKILKEEGMPDDMKYLCVIESALKQATSPTGAKGFWQFMPATAKEYGMMINREVDERLDVEISTRAACQYMRTANKKFDNWINASASYNCGVGGLSSKVKAQGVSNFFELHLNNETSRYVFRIMALKLLMENPEAYGFHPEKMELYEPFEVIYIEVEESIGNLAIWAVDNGSNLHLLKVLNPWLVGNSLTLTGSRTYKIALPKSA